MYAASREVEKKLHKANGAVEILDARAPLSTINLRLQEVCFKRNTPILRILNKTDLADPKITAQWIEYFKLSPQNAVITCSLKRASDIKKLRYKLIDYFDADFSHQNKKTIIVCGVPNVGKSTLLNELFGRVIAKVANEPAVTRVLQRIEIKKTSLQMIDTPGILWPKITSSRQGLILAVNHHLGSRSFSVEEAATFLARELCIKYPTRLRLRYKLQADGVDGIGFLEKLANTKKFVKRGNILDYEKVFRLLLQDYRSGRLGGISLECPEDQID